jgi:hypothetical protein
MDNQRGLLFMAALKKFSINMGAPQNPQPMQPMATSTP